ncbi:MAG: glycosyltransferase [Planctomycetaceae bacterium]|nr:glycosyltransferase [Planctomycetaceae bacterium]
MFLCQPKRPPLADRGPLRVMFVVTSMPVGGAESLLVELIRRMDRERFRTELCCLKQLDRLGEVLARETPVFTNLLAHKHDVRVLWRLVRLMRRRRIDAVVTVGPGDKMFWGRLAARLAGVPVICSALHSTGLPDHVETPNRLLAPLTDAFVAVAESHGCYLATHEGCPAEKVRVIPNGIDVERFHPRWPNNQLQRALNLDLDAPVAGIVAALRPIKNHEMFLYVAALIHVARPDARFLVVGDGPEASRLKALAQSLGISNAVRFLGTRSDVPELLSLMDVVLLTSRMEANPVCLLEAMASEKPVVATRVGSVSESVIDGRTGYLVAPGDSETMAARMLELFNDSEQANRMGRAGREAVIAHWSIDGMVRGYQDMIEQIYASKCQRACGQGAEQRGEKSEVRDQIASGSPTSDH